MTGICFSQDRRFIDFGFSKERRFIGATPANENCFSLALILTAYCAVGVRGSRGKENEGGGWRRVVRFKIWPAVSPGG